MAADGHRHVGSGALSGQPTATFQAAFNCLWCGRPHRTRSTDDLEGWARLCSDCVGRAQDNEFLRFRLREGLRRRSQATVPADAPADSPPAVEPTPPVDQAPPVDDMRAYYAARAPEYDDWYLRRGRYSHGVIADAAWNAEHQIQLRDYGAARTHGCALAPATRYDLVASALGGHGEIARH